MHTLLSFFFVLLLLPTSAQQIALKTDGSYLKKGTNNTLTYNRPESITAVRLIVPIGKTGVGYNTSMTVTNGVKASSADSVFNWTICDTKDTTLWAVALGYVEGKLATQDTTWFTVVPDSVRPSLTWKEDHEYYSATDWTGVAAPKKGFFSKQSGAIVLSYTVRITQGESTVKQFEVTGATLNEEQLETIAQFDHGVVHIEGIRYQHECGAELPARSGFELRYLAPR